MANSTKWPQMTNPNAMTGDLYGPAMELTDPNEAAEYLAGLVERHQRRWNSTKERAEQVERANLGYWAGYYSTETRKRVEELFGAVHPIFGSVT